jgi:hypothetical protein
MELYFLSSICLYDPFSTLGALQLVLRSDIVRILLQNGHEGHAHKKANSEGVMSFNCVFKKGHYVVYALWSITIVHLLTECCVIVLAVGNLKSSHSFSLFLIVLMIQYTVYSFFVRHLLNNLIFLIL